ncbi:histidine N-alpha-methyltransferase-like [Saccoglossus kowalevskii]
MEASEETIRKWLLSEPKYVELWYCFDTIGSQFFEKITLENPHYHLYRTEKEILKKHADEIVSDCKDVSVCELGAGNSKKTTPLFSSLLKNNKSVTYIPIDVAKDFMEHHADLLKKQFHGLEVKPFHGLYVDGLQHIKCLNQKKLILFIGSSFSNIPIHDMESFLTTVNEAMGNNDRLLIGIDIKQNEDEQVQTYSHVTLCNLILNLLTRLNREYGADFNMKNFRIDTKYVMSENMHTFVKRPQYIKVGCQSTCEQVVYLRNLDLKIHFKKGEVMYAHEPDSLSIKWNWQQFEEVMKKTGFSIEKKWSDDQQNFGVALMKKL